MASSISFATHSDATDVGDSSKQNRSARLIFEINCSSRFAAALMSKASNQTTQSCSSRSRRICNASRRSRELYETKTFMFSSRADG